MPPTQNGVLEDLSLNESTTTTTASSVEFVAEELATTEKPLPDYVCCVVTEGVWTYFACFLLIAVLFAVATLKYCKKRFEKPRYNHKGQKLHQRSVIADDAGAVSAIRKEPVPLTEFAKYVAARRKHKSAHKMELKMAAEAVKQRAAITVAERPENAEKNENRWAVPYDYNRVVLKDDGGEGDYVNASYVTDYHGDVRWVAAQGPQQDDTVADFWRMVWQERSPAVIMLTKTFDLVKIMCVQYWPSHREVPERYGDVTVTLTDEDEYAHFKVSSVVSSFCEAGCSTNFRIFRFAT